MVAAARRLFRQRGYVATAFSDVLEASEAPRGSVYFHFPGGKEELGVEVALLHLAELIAEVNRAALRARTPAELIEAFVDASRRGLVASDYREGCAVAPIIIETTPDSAQLTAVTSRGVRDIVATLAARLTEKGVPADAATPLAVATVAGTQGALIVARSLRDDSPFDAVRDALAAQATAALPSPAD
ncbi:TetR/AcrR family transcriptional regulator [Pseudonocardia alaniniphila]